MSNSFPSFSINDGDWVRVRQFIQKVSTSDLQGGGQLVPYSGAVSNVDLGSHTLTTTGIVATGNLTVSSTLLLASGSITDSTGIISFGNENISTTGTLASGTHTIGTLALASGNITDSTGAIAFGNENLSTTGSITGASFVSGTLTLTGASITDSTGAISFGNENLTTTGTIDAADFTVSGASLATIYIPYTGAVSDITIGAHHLSIGFDSTDATASLLVKETTAGADIQRWQSIDGIWRSELDKSGRQLWRVNDGTNESGEIHYTTPTGYPSIRLRYYASGVVPFPAYRNPFYLTHYDTKFLLGFGWIPWAITINSDHTVGINTWTPIAPLTVYGNTILESVSGGNSEKLYIESYSTTISETAEIYFKKSNWNTVRGVGTGSTTHDGETLGSLIFQGVYINAFATSASIKVLQIGDNTTTAAIEFNAKLFHFNSDSADNDFQIEGLSDANLFYCDAGNDRVGISTATPATTFDVVGTTRLGDSATNYAQFATDGELTLAGTARINKHVRVSAAAIALGASAPTRGYVGVFPTLAFDALHDDNCNYSLIVPFAKANSTTVQVVIDWCYTGADDTGTVRWELEYLCVADSGEAIDGATTTISKTTAGNHTSGDLIRTTLDTGIVGCVAHDILGLELTRVASVDTMAADVHLIQAHFEYIMDKLGEAT